MRVKVLGVLVGNGDEGEKTGKDRMVKLDKDIGGSGIPKWP